MTPTDHLDPLPDRADPPHRRRRVGGLLAGVCAVLIVGMWGYVWVYHLTGQGERDMPDRLDDRAWTAEADRICETYADRVDELPGAHRAATAAERADILEIATSEIARMLDELEAIAPTGSSDDARITAAWLADYRTWLADRDAYAATLREDPTARFVVTEKQGSYITAPIDRFARVNEMEACMSFGDV